MSAEVSVSSANMSFSLDLFKTIFTEKSTENVFVSPFSISTALAMTQLGARESTAVGMSKALCWPVGKEDEIHKQYQKYLQLLKDPSDSYSLATANRIYFQQKYQILDEFKEKTKSLYFAEPVMADFVSNAENERCKINSWVEEQTKDKIKDVIAPGILDDLTRMVLVNAIYFKGSWEQKFDESLTMPGDFKVAPGATKSVPMMHAEEKYALVNSSELKCQMIELPYKNRDLSMMILLPHEDFGLINLIKSLNQEKLTGLMSLLNRPKKVKLTLPSFKVTSSHGLKEVLSKLGMAEAFSQTGANFSGMTGNLDLCVSEVLHKAFIAVNEEGTEAAAATAVVMMMRCAMIPQETPKFVADHPFLYLITDRRQPGMVLFMGTVVDPSLSE